MANKISVSVVITAYNREKYIAAAVNSALNQSYAVREVIVVDDASSDATVSIVSGIEDPRVSLLVLKANGGQAHACNAGIQCATGDYVAFLDSDDVWEPFKIEQQVALANDLGPGYLIYCPVRYTHREGWEATAPKRAIHTGETVGDYLFVNGGFMQTSTLLLPTEMAQRLQFDEHTPTHTDYCFVLRAEAEGMKFAMTARPGSFWVTTATNRMSTVADVAPDVAFFHDYKTQLGFRARCGFRAKVMVPHVWRKQPLLSAQYLVQGLFFGGVSMSKVLKRAWGEVFGYDGERQL